MYISALERGVYSVSIDVPNRLQLSWASKRILCFAALQNLGRKKPLPFGAGP